MVIFTYIKTLLKIRSPLYEDVKLDRSTESMQRLIELTKRMDDIDKKRKKYELFIDAVINSISPGLLERDTNGCYKFLENKEVIKALKIAMEKVLNEGK